MNRRYDAQYIVNPETGCWDWQWFKNPAGYGQVRDDGRVRRAHHVYYERAHGPLPDGLVIDHLCRNTSCVNPDHLEAVTHAVNTHRGDRAKLTPELAAAIRDDYATGTTSHRRLAMAYGVTHHCIALILKGETWRTDGVVVSRLQRKEAS